MSDSFVESMGIETYRSHVRQILKSCSNRSLGFEQAVGGDFEAQGLMQRDLLIACGLQPDGSVVDVGCGAGRLAKPLSSYLHGSYLGTDVVPELLDHARSLVNRPDWRFELITEFTIPEGDESADIVCFFSVFTHLRHEESFVYLNEARRVVRRGGHIVFSFLEFRIPSHWCVFEDDVSRLGTGYHVDQFISRDAIHAWAEHLNLEVLDIYDGDKPHIPLSQPVETSNGVRYDRLGTLGQSTAILGRR